MAYLLYLNKILLPVTPGEINIHAPGKNETFDLIDGSEINILRVPGLKEITFDLLLPQRKYPFAVYHANKFRMADYYINKLEELRATKQPFQFILTRSITGTGSINNSFNTNLKVSIEDMPQSERAENGVDIMLSVTLKEYINRSTKTFKIDKNKAATVVTPEEPERPTDPVPLNVSRKIYTVKSGDSLWAICATKLGNGGLCWDVAKKNNIADPSSIQPGQEIDLTGF